MNEKIETLKHSMDRYDHYYDSINNKGNVYLTLNTFLLGGLTSGYYSIKETLIERCDVVFFVWIALITCLLSIGYTLWSIIPYLNKQTNGVTGSVMNFNNISNMSFASFKKIYDGMTEQKIYEEYTQQVYLLALGLQKKFYRLRNATYLLGACFMCVLIIGIKILK